MEKINSLPYVRNDQRINAERNSIFGERNVLDNVNINDGDDDDVVQNYGNPVKDDREPSASRVLDGDHHHSNGDAKKGISFYLYDHLKFCHGNFKQKKFRML